MHCPLGVIDTETSFTRSIAASLSYEESERFETYMGIGVTVVSFAACQFEQWQ